VRLDDLPPLAALSATFVDQALAGDLAGAYRTILAADDVGLPLTQLFGKVLQPALADIGRRWATGELLVAQEKEISELTRDLIADLTLRHAYYQPGAPAIVAACVEGERHELGLRVICGLLRELGYAVHYLGADVAARFLGEAVGLHRPALVLLSVKLTENLPAVNAAIEHVIGALDPAPIPPIVVGGQAARAEPEAIRAGGAVPIGDQDLEQAVAAVAALLELSAASR
jgi:methanogenic corrinoid protein MtbC1